MKKIMLSIAVVTLVILICDIWLSLFFVRLFPYSQSIISEMLWPTIEWAILWLFIILAALTNFKYSRSIILLASPFILKRGVTELSPILLPYSFALGKVNIINYANAALEIVLVALILIAFFQTNKNIFSKKGANA